MTADPETTTTTDLPSPTADIAEGTERTVARKPYPWTAWDTAALNAQSAVGRPRQPVVEVELVLGVLVAPDGTITRIEVDPGWLGIRKALDCLWIAGETLPFGVRWWADDEAHLKQRPVNEVGTRIASAAGRHDPQPLRGPVLFLGVEGGVNVGLAEEIAGWILDRFAPDASEGKR